MPTQKEFDLASELYEEAVAMYEAGKAEFAALQTMIQNTLAMGKARAWRTLVEEAGRAKLFMARVRLSRHY